MTMLVFIELLFAVSVYFAHARPWLFIISITKPFLDFIHLLLKCRSRTKATHLSLNILNKL